MLRLDLKGITKSLPSSVLISFMLSDAANHTSLRRYWGENMAKRHSALDAGFEHGLAVRVPADGGPPLDLTCLFVRERFVFFDQGEGHRQRDFRRAGKRRQKVDAFDAGACSMAVVPADQLACVCVRLMRNAIVHG